MCCSWVLAAVLAGQAVTAADFPTVAPEEAEVFVVPGLCSQVMQG